MSAWETYGSKNLVSGVGPRATAIRVEEIYEMGLLFWIGGPVVAGVAANWAARRSRGRNARTAFRSAAWGFWLLLLGNLCPFGPIPLPVVGWILNLVILLIPSAVCFLVAASSMLKEMRAQKEGEFTDAA